MTDELRKRRQAIDSARVPDTKEVASRDNDVIAGDDDLAPQPSTIRAVGSESSVPNQREIPGGSFRPARTPGALGPTRR